MAIDTENQNQNQRDTKATLEKVIDNGRQLAREYTDSKRSELEDYATKTFKSAQENVMHSFDEMLNRFGDTLDRSLNRAQDSFSGFFSKMSQNMQSGIKQIDARPMVPVIAAFVAGSAFGVLIGSRSDSIKQRVQNGVKQKVHDLKSVKNAA